MEKRIDAIKILLGANALFFVVTFLVPDMENTMISMFALYFPMNENFKVWQFVTNMFMHGGWAHILFNMYALWAFGSPLLQMWGGKKFLFFYFLSGIGAGLIYTMVNYFQFNSIYNDLVAAGVSVSDIKHFLSATNFRAESIPSFPEPRLSNLYYLFNTPALGASGAIYGVLVAFGISFPNAKLALIFLPIPIAAKYFIPILIALDLFSGVTGVSIFGGGIAHFAHIGGAIIGFLLMWYWRQRDAR